jgi:hypothetical protein
VLKVARYSIRLALSANIYQPESPVSGAAMAIEEALGTSRKAYRTGKFLKNYSALTKQKRLVPSISSSILEGVANMGEGLYYFVDQFQFLVKVGVLSKRQGQKMTMVSSAAELAGYAANIILNVLRLRNLLEREIDLVKEMRWRRRKSEEKGERFDYNDDLNKALLVEINQLRKRRLLRTLAVVQDCADAVMALNDFREAYQLGTKRTSKLVLNLCGVLSGLLGAWKRFPPAKQHA